MVVPAFERSTSSPHTFSLGFCRLITTIECGSIASPRKNPVRLSYPNPWNGWLANDAQELSFAASRLTWHHLYVWRQPQRRLGNFLNGFGRNAWGDLAQQETLRSNFNNGKLGDDHIHHANAS